MFNLIISIYLSVIFVYCFISGGSGNSGSAEGACLADDIVCNESHDRLGMEAIRSLHQQLDDDDNGNIDLSESDDVRKSNFIFFVTLKNSLLVIRTLITQKHFSTSHT